MDVQSRTSVRRVLVYRLGSLGDTVVALPGLHLIASAFPNAERRMLTNIPVASRAPAAAAVLGDSGLIQSYDRYPVGTRNPIQLARLLLRLRRFRPEVVVYLKAVTNAGTVQRDRRFLRWAGAREIVGLPLSPDLRNNLCQRDGTLEPEAARLVRTLHSLGTVHLDNPACWDLHLTGAEKATAETHLHSLNGQPFFAASIGTKVQSKDWGLSNWQALIGELARQYSGHALVLTGAPEEAATSEAAAGAWRANSTKPVLNLCGKLTPRTTAAAYRRAAAFLGHDSGPMHLAAAVGTPTVAIFAARNLPRVWFPYGTRSRVLYHPTDCMGCRLETCIAQRKKCILSITAQEVLAALQDLDITRAAPEAQQEPTHAA